MNKYLLLGATLLSTASLAGDPPFSITQNTDTITVTEQNSVACPADDDQYYRRFDLDGNHGLNAVLQVAEVEFAVESTTSLTLTVNLYSIANSAELLLANLVPISSTTVDVSDLDNGLPITASITGNIDGGIYDLVVEIVALDSTNGTSFFIGSNAAGQSGPSYISSVGCGATEPTDTADLGFSDMHIIMVVNGDIVGATDVIYADGFEVSTP